MIDQLANLTSRRRVYLVRHGHVDYFDSSGRPLDPRSVPLSSRGVEQCRELAVTLRETNFDRIYSSDYPRAVETSGILGSFHNITASSTASLREIRAGRLRDLPQASLFENVTNSYRNALNGDARFLGGERWDDFQHRITTWFLELLKETDWSCALIVTHDAVNRVLMSWLCNLGLGSIAILEQDLGCLNVVDVDTDSSGNITACLRLLNYTPYSPDKFGLTQTVMEGLAASIRPERLDPKP